MNLTTFVRRSLFKRVLQPATRRVTSSRDGSRTTLSQRRTCVASRKVAGNNLQERKLTTMCVGTVAEGNVAKGEEPATPAAIYLKDYQEYPYSIADLTMTFDLGEEKTTVHSVCRMSSKSGSSVPMMLNGDASLELKGLYVDGKPLVEGVDYDLSEKELLIKSPPSGDFVLGCITDIEPQNNTSLNGLYKSDGNFCSQCEAEGFRCITYYPDRPDVMTKFTVKIVGDKEKYPVLLSNGNLVAEGDLEGGKHYAVWVDPWKKPAYLFALVAGQYVALEDKFTTKSGRVVDLRIYTAAHNSHKTQHAMDSLKHAMKWDEDRFRLEYDLDLFNIVAADDFNMGAMENKSLNVFNSRLVLASPETATDFDYNRIEGVIGHEYFHNWTGNRVTCRDWFQLSLKEGLTVFRDQEFSSFMNSAPVKRIDDVMIVRSRQFAEDAGPMAHPVRPASYMKIDNFYTLTVYDKGAEVIRMYHTLLGEEGFQKGIDLYFERHDGQAVTTDDFYKAMEDANNTSLGSFKLWYSQAGTPTLKVTTEYNEGDKTFTLNCSQELPVTPDMTQEKKPQLIPIKIGLVSPDGKDLVLTSVQDSTGSETSIGNATTYVLKMTEMSQSFTFKNVPVKPTPSVLRNFSAPVKLEMEQSSEELKFLLSNDSDEFNKWEAGQRLITNLIFDLLKSHQSGQELQMDNSVTEAFGQVLTDDSLDKEFRAYAMELPSTEELADKIPKANPVDIHKVRNFVLKSLAAGLKDKFLQIYNANNVKGAYKPDREGKSRRSIRNCALSYLGKLADSDAEIKALLNTSFKEASNMTDQMAALGAICGNAGEDRENALKSFYTQWSNEPLVMLKWLGLQAGSNIEGNLKVMKELLEHPAFDIKNPNKVYSLVGGFTRSAVNFHAADGSGYEFLADLVIKLDKLNPQVAARMVGPFTKYKKYDDARQALMKAQLERILATKPCENVYEIVFKSL